jgi:hypothetical protein
MSTPIVIPPAPSDTNGEVPIRHPLGLPRGSVRAVLALMILAHFWILIVAPEVLAERGPRLIPMPWYLYCLMGLVFVFFASHGGSIAWAEDPEPSPLYLPGGVLRILMLLVTLGLLGWQLFTNPEALKFRLEPSPEDTARLPYLLFTLLSGYALGWVASRIFRALELNQYLQDIQASVSLVAIFLLLATFIATVFVLPTLEQQVPIHYLEYTVTAVVAWYFGVRS